jgi:APA family basic amino acid/polyamine antiporter
LPALYIILGSVFCVFLVIFKPLYTLWGLGIVLAGIPVYYITVSTEKRIKNNQ